MDVSDGGVVNMDGNTIFDNNLIGFDGGKDAPGVLVFCARRLAQFNVSQMLFGPAWMYYIFKNQNRLYTHIFMFVSISEWWTFPMTLLAPFTDTRLQELLR